MKEKMSQYDDVKMTSYTNAIFVVVFGSVKSDETPPAGGANKAVCLFHVYLSAI